MANDNKNNTSAQNNNNTEPTFTGIESEPVTLRLPECFVMMSEDSVKDGKARDGSIGLKTGDGWTWMSYMSVKKIIDLCKENREMFNKQLHTELAKMQVEEL